jgi:methylated-DNA-protein-cysteine methyltransferase-like protein
MSFTEEVVEIIKAIPKGKVATYGQVARIAGNPRAARQVVRTLNTQTKKHNLPWHRMINAQGKIAIKDPMGADEQKARLVAEGVEVSEKNTISLKKYQWGV